MTLDGAKLRSLLRARHACVRVVTDDEPDALLAALDSIHQEKLPSYLWTTLDGLREATLQDAPAVGNTVPAEAALYHLLRNVHGDHAAVFLDLAEHLENAKVLRAWRELVQRYRSTGGVLIMIDHRESVPEVVASHSTVLRPRPLSDEEVQAIIRSAVREVDREQRVEARISSRMHESLVRHLRGLSKRHVRQIVFEIVCDDFKLDESDLERALQAKRRLLQNDGMLEHVDAPTSLSQVGGMNMLKAWLAARAESFGKDAEAFGLQPPRGILLLGVQGAGKSLAAKAIATAWQRPLLRLDPGTLYDRYVGESERRLRSALSQADGMAPIVLWIDEIEKGFASAASQSTDGGLSQRMFGTLLTWMQEHRSAVFLVATANNIDALPPELLRKGRFDEIFFVDLPADEARRQIFTTHLRARRRDPARFDIPALAEQSSGFSGAEIEQAIVSALHESFAANREPTTADVLRILAISPPLSRTMAEKMDALRTWASGRCVPAD
ncbi:MAG TPA: AAA family ATPase [Phycisphaerales bacterium]